MRTQTATATPAMALAGTTLGAPVFAGGVAPELMPIGAATAPEEVGDGDAVAVAVGEAAREVAVPVAEGVGASPGPVGVGDAVPEVPLPSGEEDAATDTVRVSV